MILPFTVNALSATTANTIIGTAPYLTFDNGATKVTTTDGLLSIQLSDGTAIKASTDTSSTTPIELPIAGDKFASIETLVPLRTAGNTTYPSIALNNVIKAPYNYWGDDDGDGTPTATGTLSVRWYSNSTTTSNGTDITSSIGTNPNAEVSLCDAPYRLTITATNGSLSTKYGVPRTSNFTGDTHSYFINPKPPTKPFTCFARPNLSLGSGDNAGPANQWNPAKGFLPQTLSTPSSNFPSTGMNDLFFDLTVAGTTAQQVISSTSTSPKSGNGVTLSLSAPNGNIGNVVRVTLKGPTYSSGGGNFSASTFEINSGSTLIYSFVISKWFIRGDTEVLYTEINSRCGSLAGGYRVPDPSDHSNHPTPVQQVWNPYAPTAGKATRTIGGGFYSDWGNDAFIYWTSQHWSDPSYWDPNYNNGKVWGASYNTIAFQDMINVFYGDTFVHPLYNYACVRP